MARGHVGWTDKFEAIESWWRDTVTARFLVVSAAFLVLSAALLHTTLQRRKLKRIIAPPPIKPAKRPWRLFSAFHDFVTKTARKMKEPLKGPGLDERAIREAFKPDTKQRQEFDL
jgi:hypothetical protein